MASEAQRLIGLSLNKIISSRTRRGGISLHRNLLVASVLLKARDVYVADTAAANKLKSLGDNVIIAEENEQEERPQEVPQSKEADDASSESYNTNDCEEDMDTSDFQNSSTDVIDSSTNDTQSEGCSQLDTRSTDVDNDDEQYKENISPVLSSNTCDARLSAVDGSNTDNDNSAITCKRKRAYTEVEQAVTNIGQSSDMNNSEHRPLHKKTRLNLGQGNSAMDSTNGNRIPLNAGLQAFSTKRMDDTSHNYSTSRSTINSSISSSCVRYDDISLGSTHHTLILATM
jgi:hypothetical protein